MITGKFQIQPELERIEGETKYKVKQILQSEL
jgi:hypothetical protein